MAKRILVLERQVCWVCQSHIVWWEEVTMYACFPGMWFKMKSDDRKELSH
jgi:hypothetical protein